MPLAVASRKSLTTGPHLSPYCAFLIVSRNTTLWSLHMTWPITLWSLSIIHSGARQEMPSNDYIPDSHLGLRITKLISEVFMVKKNSVLEVREEIYT